MNVAADTALLPVQYAVTRIEAVEPEGYGRAPFRDAGEHPLRFLGYGKLGVQGNYGRCGRKAPDRRSRGGLVDVYV